LRQNPDIEMAELKGELLLLNNASNKFYVMNSTAAFVWGKLASPTGEDELVSALCESFQGGNRRAGACGRAGNAPADA
jgi:hypothetical protein